MFLIFYLDDDLKVYKGSEFVKPELLEVVFREGKFLNLAEKFEFVFSNVACDIDLSKIYFLLGERAGFTDTRVVYTWAKSWEIFNPQKSGIFIHKLEEKVDLLRFDNSEFADFLQFIESQSTDNLVYSSDPRIGTK